MTLRALVLAAGVACGAPWLTPPAATAQLPPSTLAVRVDGEWERWWDASRPPAAWPGPLARLTSATRWEQVADGVELGEVVLRGSSAARRVRVVLVRLDPARVRLRTQVRLDAGGRARGWQLGDAPDDALVALNAGQFTAAGPWGWVVHRGVELRRPGSGPLSAALVVDSAGRARLVPADSVAVVRAAGGVADAFQSYPVVLAGEGVVPDALRAPGRGVDLAHRDARLAVGTLADGRLLFALTRFDALGGALDALPFGLTTPEMAALMGALGARRAMLLDGGISGQLLVRGDGETRQWRGLRDVPLGVIALPRSAR